MLLMISPQIEFNFIRQCDIALLLKRACMRVIDTDEHDGKYLLNPQSIYLKNSFT